MKLIVRLTFFPNIDTFRPNRYHLDTTFSASGIYRYQVSKIDTKVAPLHIHTDTQKDVHIEVVHTYKLRDVQQERKGAIF